MSADARFRTRGDIYQATVEGWVIEAYLALEERLEQAEPSQRPPRTIVQRCAPLLRVVGALNLGLLAAAFAIFVDFVILNFIFHMQP
ncbi:MAG TPA: hypothetical protein VHA35_25690 [Dongiaceae bacterium]|jgi:hypothetical protein|nr:hypothetical protein [Dongiaceae bacterium]